MFLFIGYFIRWLQWSLTVDIVDIFSDDYLFRGAQECIYPWRQYVFIVVVTVCVYTKHFFL